MYRFWHFKHLTASAVQTVRWFWVRTWTATFVESNSFVYYFRDWRLGQGAALSEKRHSVSNNNTTGRRVPHSLEPFQMKFNIKSMESWNRIQFTANAVQSLLVALVDFLNGKFHLGNNSNQSNDADRSYRRIFFFLHFSFIFFFKFYELDV